MSKITIEDICREVAENPVWFFDNGFFYDVQKNIISRDELRKQVAYRWGKYERSAIDKVEEVITEHNKIKDSEPRKIYLNSLKREQGECFIYNWLCEEYPSYNWKQILYDMIMHKSEKIYLFFGVPHAGKSQIMDLLKVMFDEYYTPLTLNQMGNRFNLGECVGKLFIAGDDLGTEGLGEMGGIVKSMATGQTSNLERKFLAPVKCKNEGNFMFNTNKEPILDLTDAGILRRFIILNFDKKMKLSTSYQQMRKTFINEEQASRLLSIVWEVEHDREYIEELNKNTQIQLIKKSSVYVSKTENYETYANYCFKYGYKAFNKENFDKMILYIKELFTTPQMKQQGMQLVIDDGDLPF